jgi:DNA-binding PadR family transcriptional regulator
MRDVSLVEEQILELIEANNGQWYWYQIDQAISMQGHTVGPFWKELDWLKEQGYYEEKRRDNAVQPTYWITDKGKKLLQKKE